MKIVQPWIFVDFDGTAIDNLSALKKAFFQFGKKISIKFTDKDFEISNGPSYPAIMSDIRDRFPEVRKYSVAELISLHDDCISESYHRAKPRSNLRESLLYLKKRGWKCALVTSAPKQVIMPFFKIYKWQDIFEFVVTSEDVQKAKPHPDIYLYAQKKTGSHGPFVAVEDSHIGLNSAKLAGCITIRFDQKSIGFFNIQSFRDLRNRLKFLNNQTFLTGKPIKARVDGELTENIYSSQDDVKKLQDIWKKDSKDKKQLFDGLTYVIEEEEKPYLLKGKLVRYRHIYPQLKLKKSSFPIRLAVSAALRLGRTFYVSKRSKNVTEFPGKWEFAPSGGVSSEKEKGMVYLDKQIMGELQEEFNIGRKDIKKIKPILSVCDLRAREIEVFYEIILKNKSFSLGEEHSHYDAFSLGKIKKMVSKNPEAFTPITSIVVKSL